MDFLKYLPTGMLLGLMPMLLIKLGNSFKNKDENETGTDDAFGNVLIAMAPAIEAITIGGNETAFKKALRGVYITLGNYLGYPAPK